MAAVAPRRPPARACYSMWRSVLGSRRLGGRDWAAKRVGGLSRCCGMVAEKSATTAAGGLSQRRACALPQHFGEVER